MKLHHTKIPPSAFASTTAALGYPASNVGDESIAMPWRATGAGAEDFVITFAAPLFVQTLFLHGVNFATANIEKSVDGVAWVAVGAMTTYGDRHGRRRGQINVNAAGQLALKVKIAAGAPLDGAAYWTIAAAYAFTTAVAIAAAPSYGYRVRTRRPRVSRELPNGLVATARTGRNVDRIDLAFMRKNSEAVDELVQRTSAGTCLIDMELPNYPEQLWPVRFLEQDLEEGFSHKNVSDIAVALTEVTGT